MRFAYTQVTIPIKMLSNIKGNLKTLVGFDEGDIQQDKMVEYNTACAGKHQLPRIIAKQQDLLMSLHFHLQIIPAFGMELAMNIHFMM